MDVDMQETSVRCLSSFGDLEIFSTRIGIQWSSSAKLFAVHHTLKRLGSYNVQKVTKQLVQKGELKWDEDKDFEVQAILDYAKDNDDPTVELYLIKWKGWTNEHNTWEPKEHLTCPNLVDLYHKLNNAGTSRSTIVTEMSAITGAASTIADQMRLNSLSKKMVAENITPAHIVDVLRQVSISKRKAGELFSPTVKRIKMRTSANINLTDKRSKAYKVLKTEMDLALKQWEKRMNDVDVNQAHITVENKVDLDGPPDKFIYTNDYIEGPGIIIPQDPLIGCECDNCLDEKKVCCGANAGSQFAYYKNKRVRVPSGTPIYECNKYCKCSRECPNRVVQLGRQHKVCLFKTVNGRGWGVKALQKIKKGSFVVEYVGEVITHEEAERRGKIYDGAGRTYLFDLDYNDDDCPYTVDAGCYGNISHFINHSCDPNLSVYGVWINTLDPRLPRIALFAKRDINKEEELTFDYMMTADTTGGFGVRAAQLNTSTTEDSLSEAAKPNVVKPLGKLEPEEVDSEVEIKKTHLIDEKTRVNVDAALPEASEALMKPPLLWSGDAVLPPGDAGGHSADRMPPTPPPSETQEALSIIPSLPNGPAPAAKFRVVCQCGAANCRGFLY